MESRFGVIKISRTRISVHHISAYGMYLFLLLLPFEYPLETIGVGSILRYVGILTIALVLVDLLKEGTIKMDYRALLMVAWCAYAALSGIWSVDKANYSRYISMYVNNALMFIAISLVPFSKSERDFIEKGLVSGVVLLLLYMTFVPGAVTQSDWQSRLTLAHNGKSILDQNYLAALMLMAFGCQLFDLIESKQGRFTKTLVCLAIFYYILRTGSRSGLLGAGVIAAFCLARGVKRRSGIVFALIFLLLLIGPAVISFLPSDLLERFSRDAMLGQTSESGGRLDIWAIAWEAIKEGSAFFGYGAGSSEYLVGLSYKENAAIHNFVIAHMVELGLVGLSLFGAILIKIVRQLKAFGEEKLFIAFMGIIVEGLFLDLLTTKFFWSALMMVSVSITAGNCMRREIQNQPAKGIDTTDG